MSYSFGSHRYVRQTDEQTKGALGSPLFWGVTQLRSVLDADVSGQPIGPIFKRQAVQEEYWERLCS